MPVVTIVLAALLIVLGAAGYAASGMAAPTALIPAGFGIVFAALGAAARKEPLRKHAMHAAAALALIGFLATAAGVIEVFAMLAGDAPEQPLASSSKAVMALALAAFLVLCVRSFRAARKARVTGSQEQ